MSDAEFSVPLRVYIEDTDAGGIVYYVNYLKFMERARTEFMRARGFGKQYIFTHELMFVVSDARIHYRSPARLDDELRATACLTRLRGASLEFHQRVLRGEEPLAQADIKIACVNRSSMQVQRIPPELGERLAAWVQQSD
tara:strand:- start:7738 stop:8157 length:420 start_codon:yes stop_codon:yes gene_type:complete